MLQDVTNVSDSIHRKFFFRFLRWGFDVLYPQCVKLPSNQTKFDEIMCDYKTMGFPGVMGSIDATHVKLNRCPDNYRQDSTGKEHFPTRVFQVCVSFNRRILHSTSGNFGSWNDKTISKYDPLLIALSKDTVGQDIKWNLKKSNGTIKPMVGGLHLICDGGYPSWPFLIAPKVPSSDPEVLEWNEQLVAIRKDVECTFGIF